MLPVVTAAVEDPVRPPQKPPPGRKHGWQHDRPGRGTLPLH